MNLGGGSNTSKTLTRAGKNEEKDECLCTGMSTHFAGLQGGSYLMYFLRDALPTPAEIRIFRERLMSSTVPVYITISHFCVKN